jgi:hypothetical protein
VKLGDKNTRYFHHVATHQKRKNQIDIIEHEGQSSYDYQQKAQIIYRYFCGLVGSQPAQEMNFYYTTIIQPHAQNL